MQIDELILKTQSLARTRLFYQRTLELEIVAEAPGSVTFQAGKTRLVFEETSEERPFYHFAFNVTNNRFSDCFEWMDSKLDVMQVAPGMPMAAYPDWNAQSFYFSDNNGSILECIVRFDLPYQSDESFSSRDLVEISEIGIVTDDVLMVSEDLRAAGVPYFRKGPRLHDFVAMGDDLGLLLVAREGRGWVPNHKHARSFPVTVVAGGQHFLFNQKQGH